jgi:hypothetical protein
MDRKSRVTLAGVRRGRRICPTTSRRMRVSLERLTSTSVGVPS